MLAYQIIIFWILISFSLCRCRAFEWIIIYLAWLKFLLRRTFREFDFVFLSIGRRISLCYTFKQVGLSNFHFSMLVPLVTLDQNDNEILRDHSNNLASNVHHWKWIHALLGHFVKPLDCADAFQDFKLIVHGQSVAYDVSNSHKPSLAGHIVPQYW